MSDFHIFRSVLVRDPYLVVGLLFVGVPTVSYWYIYRKLSEAGFKYPPRFALPAIWCEAYVREYARQRVKFGWPAWPLHVMWLGLAVGIPLVVLGVSKL
jgi:hypothetical protein